VLNPSAFPGSTPIVLLVQLQAEAPQKEQQQLKGPLQDVVLDFGIIDILQSYTARKKLESSTRPSYGWCCCCQCCRPRSDMPPGSPAFCHGCLHDPHCYTHAPAFGQKQHIVDELQHLYPAVPVNQATPRLGLALRLSKQTLLALLSRIC